MTGWRLQRTCGASLRQLAVGGKQPHLPWENDKPHVIYGYAIVDPGNTLTINEGCQVYLHKNSGLIIGNPFKEEKEEPQFDAVIGSTLANFEQLGLKNIITKQEEFVTQSGVKGMKTYGTGTLERPNGDSKRAKYNILTFGGKGFIQQVVITWEEEDEYAEQIVDRILGSLDVKTQV